MMLNDRSHTYPPEAYGQIDTLALQARCKLPNSGAKKTEELSKIREGPDELYQDFVFSWAVLPIS